MDNQGLETIFSLLKEPESDTWPVFKPITNIVDYKDVFLDQSDILPGSALWNPGHPTLESSFTAIIQELISKIYRTSTNTDISLEILNSIYTRSERIFFKLVDKLALMQKLIMQEEGPQSRRNRLHVPDLKPQNASSVFLAVSALGVDESVLSGMRDRIHSLQNV